MSTTAPAATPTISAGVGLPASRITSTASAITAARATPR